MFLLQVPSTESKDMNQNVSRSKPLGAFLLTLDKAQTAGSWSVTAREQRVETSEGNNGRAALLRVSLHRLTKHRSEAYKRLKSSL